MPTLLSRCQVHARDNIKSIPFASTKLPARLVVCPFSRPALVRPLTTTASRATTTTMRTILQDAAGAPTKAVYQYDETLRKHLTRVTSIRALSDLSEAEQELFKQAEPDVCVLETTDTIFYAQSGGQPFDLGYMVLNDSGQKETRFEVEAVRYGAEGRILHFGRFHEGTSAPGDMVEQHIDGARRDLNSRCHTAGHILGLAVRRIAEQTAGLDVTELKAQHYPDASFL